LSSFTPAIRFVRNLAPLHSLLDDVLQQLDFLVDPGSGDLLPVALENRRLTEYVPRALLRLRQSGKRLTMGSCRATFDAK
jgi:hypothetical protein